LFNVTRPSSNTPGAMGLSGSDDSTPVELKVVACQRDRCGRSAISGVSASRVVV
jgi:hypothetical protein